jgi:hypothetical protein
MGKIKPTAEHLPSTTLASGNAASAAGASDSTWGAGVDSSTGGATYSSATVAEGSSPSQDKFLDFLQKYTKLVVIQVQLLHQVLLGKVQYLQAGPDYRHGRGSKDAGNIH